MIRSTTSRSWSSAFTLGWVDYSWYQWHGVKVHNARDSHGSHDSHGRWLYEAVYGSHGQPWCYAPSHLVKQSLWVLEHHSYCLAGTNHGYGQANKVTTLLHFCAGIKLYPNRWTMKSAGTHWPMQRLLAVQHHVKLFLTHGEKKGKSAHP